MYCYVLFLTCATIASAKFHLNNFAERTCEVLNTWNENTTTGISVQYIYENNEHSILLSNDCQNDLESILAKCLDSTGLKCNNMLLSIVDKSPADKVASRRGFVKRLQSGEPNSESCPYTASDLSITKSSDAVSSASMSSGVLDLTDSMTSTTLDGTKLGTGGMSSTISSGVTFPTGHQGALGSSSRTSGSMKAMKTSTGRICLIKESELYTAGKGSKCRCSDGEEIKYSVAACEIEF